MNVFSQQNRFPNFEISSCSATNFCRYVEHLFQCEICSVSQWNADCLGKFLPMNVAEFHRYSHKTCPQIIECFSPSPATFEILFCLFRT